MELKELAREYRESGRLCYERAVELRQSLCTYPAAGQETMLLRRRIAMLENMARDAGATSKYLENYYGRPEKNGEKSKKNGVSAGDGILDFEELCKAIRAAGKQSRGAARRSAGA